MQTTIRITAAAAVLTLAAGTLAASDAGASRKLHRAIALGSEDPVARYTHITHLAERGDDRRVTTRTLYEGREGSRAVVRSSVGYRAGEAGRVGRVESVVMSFESLATGESMTLETSDGVTATVSIGSEALSYPVGAITRKTVREAAALLDSTSERFRAELRAMVEAGLHAPELFDVAVGFGNLFYADLDVTFRDAAGDPEGLVVGFDPVRHPPTPFDEPFGAHYFR